MANSEEVTADLKARINGLEAKIQGLEANIKARSRSVLTLGLAFMFFVVWSTYLPRTFSGRWLGLHDQHGTLRTWVDDQGLELKDTFGNTRARLGVGLDGSPSLQFFDAKHQLRSHLFIYADGSSYLMLWDKDGKGVRYPPPSKPMP